MTMTAQQLREKISAWLSDKTNHEGDLVDFLVDDCGVEYNPEWEDEDEEEEEPKLCWTCDEKVGTHKEFRDALGEEELTCDKCHRQEYEEEGHYIVYGEWKIYDDDGVCGTRNDEFTEYETKEEALLKYNRLIKEEEDEENYDLIYLDYVEGEGAEGDKENIECWEKPQKIN